MSIDVIPRSDVLVAGEERNCASAAPAPPSPAIPELEARFFLLACLWIGLYVATKQSTQIYLCQVRNPLHSNSFQGHSSNPTPV